MAKMASPGSALGEAVGNLIEDRILKLAKEVVEPKNWTANRQTLRNHTGSTHQIDIVISNEQGQPIILVEPKYLRYTKHNYDKGCRFCVAHERLRRTFPSIRKSIGILAGNWTEASVRLIESFGVEVYRIPFEHVADVMTGYGIPFRWHEKDTATPKRAWEKFCELTEADKADIGEKLTQPVQERIRNSIRNIVELDPNTPRRVKEIEVTVKTSEGEILLHSFTTVVDAIRELTRYMTDVDDLRSVQQPSGKSRP